MTSSGIEFSKTQMDDDKQKAERFLMGYKGKDGVLVSYSISDGRRKFFFQTSVKFHAKFNGVIKFAEKCHP